MFWRNVTANLWKMLVFMAAFAIVVYVSIEFRVWSGEFTFYFIRVGEWEKLIFVSLVVAAISMVLIWLLRLQFRLSAGRRRR